MNGEGAGFNLEMLEGAGTTYRSYTAGEKIFVAEDEGDCMYVVRSGVVEIRFYGAILDRVKPGEFFGEIALIDGAPRTATAVAAEDCVVGAIYRDGFLSLVRQRPEFALEVMRTLARRLRGMNESM